MDTRNDNLREESGSVLITMAILLIPLVVVIGTFTMTMTSRTDRLLAEIGDEQTLLAAEAGLDDAIYRAMTGSLTSGNTFQATLGPDVSYSVTPTYLGSNGLDEDEDGTPDDADEDVFQLVIAGVYRTSQRRLAAYLGPTDIISGLSGAVTVQNPNVSITLNGTPSINGHNHDIGGALGDPAYSKAGLTIASPGTVTDLQNELNGSEANAVTGIDPSTGSGSATPSLDTTTAIDLDPIVAEAKNTASVVLTNPRYGNYNFGDASAGEGYITYREGDVRFAGNTVGAGLLVVTGDLIITGNFHFDGIVVVLGDIYNGSGTASVNGSIVQADTGADITNKGTLDLTWSQQAVDFANSLGNRYVAFNGWQELSRRASTSP